MNAELKLRAVSFLEYVTKHANFTTNSIVLLFSVNKTRELRSHKDP